MQSRCRSYSLTRNLLATANEWILLKLQMKHLLVTAFTALCFAQQPVGHVATGPAVGTRVPDFKAPDTAGRTRNLQSVMGPKGALLVFFRSADW